jgi:hypothetical protein
MGHVCTRYHRPRGGMLCPARLVSTPVHLLMWPLLCPAIISLTVSSSICCRTPDAAAVVFRPAIISMAVSSSISCRSSQDQSCGSLRNCAQQKGVLSVSTGRLTGLLLHMPPPLLSGTAHGVTIPVCTVLQQGQARGSWLPSR